MKVVIIGGVAGGATAAARLRRLDEQAEIVMLERSGYISYANCGLPYYVGGVITDQEELTLQTPESFRRRFAVDVRVRHEATAIDPTRKTVTVRRLEDGSEYEEAYDKLLLSPGARPLRPALPGVESARVFTLRTVEDTLRLHTFIQSSAPRSAVVVGGGFIGLEMMENLTHQGIQVTVVEKQRQVMAPIDYDMACGVHAYLRDMGVALRLDAAVEGFEETDSSLSVRLEGGERLETDMVVLALGVVPDTGLAKEAGLTLGGRGAIVVNDRMETSAPDIYAVGDAVQITHAVTGDPAWVPLAGPANKQGRIAADNISGRDSRFDGSQGTSILRVFDMTVAATGLNERAAEAAGYRFDKVVTFSPSHATYYPGASNMTIKTVFERGSGRILGAQIVGFEGADKRIDVLAAAVRGQMGAADLAELELAYAPPFSSAKDPVNMAGFVIGNLLDGTVRQFHWNDVPGVQHNPEVTLLDTRTPGEYRRGHIKGAVHISLDELRDRLEELDKGKPVYVHCQSGLRSYIACRILTGHGFTCYNLSGGYRLYEQVMREAAFDSRPAHPCGVPLT